MTSLKKMMSKITYQIEQLLSGVSSPYKTDKRGSLTKFLKNNIFIEHIFTELSKNINHK